MDRNFHGMTPYERDEMNRDEECGCIGICEECMYCEASPSNYEEDECIE